MKMKVTIHFILAVAICFALIACNQQAKTDEAAQAVTTNGAAKTGTSSMPEYDPAMDPLKVEAAFLKVLADTLNVKLYEATFKPGDSVGLHTHPDHVLYVVEGGTLTIYAKDGTANVLELKAGMGLVLASETHSGKNSGKTTVKLLVADIYRPRG